MRREFNIRLAGFLKSRIGVVNSCTVNKGQVQGGDGRSVVDEDDYRAKEWCCFRCIVGEMILGRGLHEVLLCNGVVVWVLYVGVPLSLSEVKIAIRSLWREGILFEGRRDRCAL